MVGSAEGRIIRIFPAEAPKSTRVGTPAGTSGAHGAPMASILMSELDREWAAIAHSKESARAFALAAEADPVIGASGASDLGGLVAQVRPGPDRRAPVERGRLVASLLATAPLHPLLVRATVQAVAPALPRELVKLGSTLRAWASLDDALTEALAVLSMVVVEWAGQDRAFACGDMLSAVRCRIRRQALAELSLRNRQVTPLGHLESAVDRGRSGIDELAAVLADPATSGLCPADAALVSLVGVYGYHVAEVARMTGQGRRSLTRRIERAQRCLVA